MNEPGKAHSIAGNIGAYLDARTSLYPRSFAAGSGSDNTFLEGEDINRSALKMPHSALFVTTLRLVMASGEQAVISQGIQHKEEDGAYDEYPYADGTDQPEDVTIEANDDGSAIVTQLKVPVDLAGAKQYVKHRVKINLSASGTDTAAVSSVAVLGGLESLPVE